jgi:hypothetical protein
MRAVSPPCGCVNTGRAGEVERVGDLQEQVQTPGTVDKTFAREAAREIRGCGVVALSHAASIGGPVARELLYIKRGKMQRPPCVCPIPPDEYTLEVSDLGPPVGQCERRC